MIWAKLLAGIVGLLNAFSQWIERERAKADGAAIQRDKDMRAENEKVSKSDRARDDVRTGGGVPIDEDPFNRDNG